MSDLVVSNVILKNQNIYNFNFENQSVYLIFEQPNTNFSYELFHYLIGIKTPLDGSIELNDISLSHINGENFRKYLATIILEENVSIKNFKISKIIKKIYMSTNNSHFLDYVDFLTEAKKLCLLFDLSEDIFRKKINNLSQIEFFYFKLFESVIKKSNYLIIYKSLDSFSSEDVDKIIKKLFWISSEYNQTILVFSNCFENTHLIKNHLFI